MSFPNLASSGDGDHVIGVDLGGSYMRALLCDLDGRELADRTEVTPRGDAPAVIAALTGLARGLADAAELDWSRVAAVAIGVPGVADPADGALRLAPNLPSFGALDVGGALADELGVPVGIENDVNVATVAEHRRGLGTETGDFVFIAVGTGIGMGIVSGGRLLRGATGAAGEICALPIGADPFDPANHVRGPLEEGAAGIGLAHRYAERSGRDIDAAAALDLFAAATGGDLDAEAVIAHQARSLALAVVAVHSVLDPSVVVFGGGMGTREDLLARVREHLPRLSLRPIRVEASRLGARAGLLGAAELARDLALAEQDAVGGGR